MRPWLIAAQAFALARWRQLILSDRRAINRHHQIKLKQLTAQACRNLPFYRPFEGQPFEMLPVIDKAIMLENFSAINGLSIEAETIRQMLSRGDDHVEGLRIGQSTGTSGNRGYYVISDDERFIWLGTILAKTLPDALWRHHRVALALPNISSLYRSATIGSRIDLEFFDLAEGVEAWIERLKAFGPDTIVAPPKVLRWLAEHGALAARHIFSGAEVLDQLDRQIIEAATGRKVREIYMATEGLFGVACPYGTLHLAEDVVHFEWQPMDHGKENCKLQSPIITDFTRRAQAMIRYQMNDLIELSDRPCPCGSAFRAVHSIVGRQDDTFLLVTHDGAERLVTPDVVRNCIVDSDAAIKDFRVVQVARNDIEVSLEDSLSDQTFTVVEAHLNACFANMGLAPKLMMKRGLTVPYDRKLRRVMRATFKADTH